MTTLHADLELARRLEEFESAISAEFARGLVPDAAVVEVAGGRAVFAGVGGVLTEAKALGLNGPVSGADLDRLEAAFFDRGAEAKVVVCPMADASLLSGLGERGYRLVEFEGLLYRRLDGLRDLPEPSSEIEVRPIGPDEGELYADVVATGFCHPEPVTPEMRELSSAPVRIGGSTPLLARIGGQAAGGGTLLVRDDLAMLAGAATLPEFRRRGVQAALSVARLRLARDRGARIIVQGAAPGSASQRTAERLGFRVAYTKAVLLRERP